MEPWQSTSESNLVEAIEEGRIVKVSEDYAKREGLPILRKQQPKIPKPAQKKDSEEKRLFIDDLRKPLKALKSQVMTELVDNFQWEIAKKRRQLAITRKQLAASISEPEYVLKLLENGILPKDDFVIINKLQAKLNLNLRKDKKDFIQPARNLIEEPKENAKKESSSKKTDEGLLGDDIQPFDED